MQQDVRMRVNQAWNQCYAGQLDDAGIIWNSDLAGGPGCLDLCTAGHDDPAGMRIK
jgi:hypothetical protein